MGRVVVGALKPARDGMALAQIRQLCPERSAVLLLRRTQDGEMYEVNAGIRLQQVAPGALARMRLPGHQQNTKLVAYPVNRDDRAVVDLRKLVLERCRFDLDDIRSGMWDR